MKERLIVDEGAAGERLDRFLAGRELAVSRSHIQKLIESGCVLVNGRTAKANAKLREGDAVETGKTCQWMPMRRGVRGLTASATV